MKKQDKLSYLAYDSENCFYMLQSLRRAPEWKRMSKEERMKILNKILLLERRTLRKEVQVYRKWFARMKQSRFSPLKQVKKG